MSETLIGGENFHTSVHSQVPQGQGVGVQRGQTNVPAAWVPQRLHTHILPCIHSSIHTYIHTCTFTQIHMSHTFTCTLHAHLHYKHVHYIGTHLQYITCTFTIYYITLQYITLHTYTHHCIYIYAVVLLSGPSLAFWGVIIWAKFVFLQNTVCQKHYKHRGFSTFVFEKNCARKFEVLLSGPSWSFLRCSQLGPNNNTYLAQIITPQNAFFFNFLLLKICWNTYFYSVFWTSTKNWQKRGKKKTITFHILQNTGS